MKRQLYLCGVVLVLAGHLHAQTCNQHWSNFDPSHVTPTGSSALAEGFLMVLDAGGNPHVVFKAGTSEVGLVKIEGSSGNTLWEDAFCAPAPANCGAYIPNAIQVDAAGNVYIAGYEHNYGSTAFGLGVWIRKYNSAGSLLWSDYRALNLGPVQRIFTTTTTRPAIFLELDNAGNAYLVSRVYSPGIPLFNPFIEKFDPNGNSLWAQLSPFKRGEVKAMDMKPNGDFVIAGGYQFDISIESRDSDGNLLWDFEDTNGLGTFGVSYGTGSEVKVLTYENNLAPPNNTDFKVLHFSATGTLTSSTVFGVAGYEYPVNFEIDAQGNYVIAGHSTQTTGLPYLDWFVLKGDPAGNVLWSDRYNERTDNDEFVSAWERGLSLDASGNVYVTGAGGPTFLSGIFAVPAGVTIKYNGNTGVRECVQIDQTYLGTGMSVLPYGSDFYVSGYSKRKVVKYGNTPLVGIQADIFAFLKGAYGTPTFSRTMNLSLNSLLPLSQPYNAPPWNYTGTESVTVMPPSVVDWVLIEARTSPAASSAYQRKVGFVHNNNGWITDVKGNSLNFASPPVGNAVYFVVYHRNHLPIMSAIGVTANTGGKHRADLTSIIQLYGGINAGTVVNNGVIAMISGDANADGDINAIDKALYWYPQNGSTNGYYEADFNLDGDVDAIDKNIYLKPFNGRITQVPY